MPFVAEFFAATVDAAAAAALDLAALQLAVLMCRLNAKGECFLLVCFIVDLLSCFLCFVCIFRRKCLACHLFIRLMLLAHLLSLIWLVLLILLVLPALYAFFYLLVVDSVVCLIACLLLIAILAFSMVDGLFVVMPLLDVLLSGQFWQLLLCFFCRDFYSSCLSLVAEFF